MLAEGSATAAQPSAEWAEEQVVLSAIHGNGISFPSPSQAALSLRLPDEAAKLLRRQPEVKQIESVSVDIFQGALFFTIVPWTLWLVCWLPHESDCTASSHLHRGI